MGKKVGKATKRPFIQRRQGPPQPFGPVVKPLPPKVPGSDRKSAKVAEGPDDSQLNTSTRASREAKARLKRLKRKTAHTWAPIGTPQGNRQRLENKKANTNRPYVRRPENNTQQKALRLPGAKNLESVHRMVLEITHVPTGFGVSFPAMLELFSDAYTSEWNAEQVYGRMDPIATFGHTRRALSLAWAVPAESLQHAKENLVKVNRLLSFLYPLYDRAGGGGAAVINQGPLLKIRFGNLVQDAVTGGPLLGYCNGFTFDPALEYGMFTEQYDPSQFKNKAMRAKSGGLLDRQHYYPKTFRLNCEFNVLHQHALGFAVSQEQVTTSADQKRGRSAFKRTYTFNDKRLHKKTGRGTGRREATLIGDFERGGPNSIYPYHTHAGREQQRRTETIKLPLNVAPNDPRRLKTLVYDPTTEEVTINTPSRDEDD
tara:strand:+ start:412 stop:1695 length:1284 start_codon:yes stop_codon:yes gene_type:complete